MILLLISNASGPLCSQEGIYVMSPGTHTCTTGRTNKICYVS